MLASARWWRRGGDRRDGERFQHPRVYQDSVEGVYLVLELIGRAQQVGGRCVGEAQPGDFMPSIIDALINRHPYFLSLLVRVPPRPAMMAAKRS